MSRNSGTPLANDGIHVTEWAPGATGVVHLLLLGWGSGCHGGALAGLTPKTEASQVRILRTWSLCSS